MVNGRYRLANGYPRPVRAPTPLGGAAAPQTAGDQVLALVKPVSVVGQWIGLSEGRRKATGLH